MCLLKGYLSVDLCEFMQSCTPPLAILSKLKSAPTRSHNRSFLQNSKTSGELRIAGRGRIVLRIWRLSDARSGTSNRLLLDFQGVSRLLTEPLPDTHREGGLA